MWNAIEGKTSERFGAPKFRWFPMGSRDKRSHLPIAVDEFDNAEREALVQPEEEEDESGLPVWRLRDEVGVEVEVHVGATPPDEREWQRDVTARRRHRVQWSERLILTPKQKRLVRDRHVEFDHRSAREYARQATTERKRRITRPIDRARGRVRP